MTDKKFTDEEIIKRLKYVRKNTDEGYMAHLENGGEVDKNEEEYIDILCGTLDLINRQKAEIERLQKEVNLVSIQFQDLQERTNEVKAESYKEFVNRLKNSNEFYNCIRAIGNVDKMDSVVNCVDTFLKEMVGEEK